jgi:hypothetical protein
LQVKKWEEIFTDRFAGDFGHMTPFGHELIADKLSPYLIKIIKDMEGTLNQ